MTPDTSPNMPMTTLVGLDDLTPELMAAAAALGMAMARFENELDKVKKAKEPTP